ncbi:MAG: hypothetical protein RLY71_3202 [Pseudomonadota bacterium]|jgi:hypothetical protein
MRFEWSKLNKIQKGTFGEHFAKMEFAMYGFLVFSAEIDDRGIDFVARRDDGHHFDVQVKTITGKNYTFINQSKFNKDLIICLVILKELSPPTMYLFIGSDWEKDTSGLLTHKHFPSQKEAEYGINITICNLPLLSAYEFDKRACMLLSRQEI